MACSLKTHSAAAGVVLACATLPFASSVRANEAIQIVQPGCALEVHLVARSAPLAEVLRQLSVALGFELQLAGSSDSIIDVDVSREAPALVAKLSSLDNLIVTQARDPQCPGRYRVVKVWMLPKGGQEALVRAAETRPIPHQLSEAEKRQIQENDDMYRRAHSLPLAPPQDDASK